MTEKTAFPSNDGHIESIVIGIEQVKVSFQTWNGIQFVLIFDGVENVISSHSVYGDIGEFRVQKLYNGNNKYTFEDAWNDENGNSRICLTIEAKEMRIYEVGKSKELDSALFDVGKDFLGEQKRIYKN